MSDRQSARPERATNPNRTRDHLANERTLLAWMRSAIAIVALGFVVARFGLLLRELGTATGRHVSARLSTWFGVTFVLCGAVLLVLATARYHATAHAIEDDTYEPAPWLLVALTGGFVVVAVALAVYLFVTA